MSRLLRWVSALVAIATIAVSNARAQGPAQTGDSSGNYGGTYFVGILMMILVMVIVCMPSRKRQRLSKDDN
jgi:cytochrome b561